MTRRRDILRLYVESAVRGALAKSLDDALRPPPR